MSFATNTPGILTQSKSSRRVTSLGYDNIDRADQHYGSSAETHEFRMQRALATAAAGAINQRYEFVYDPLGRVTQVYRPFVR
ncbi:MAG: hypothetical protein ACREBC_16880 [Pyrinomonadaceae bacterium]